MTNANIVDLTLCVRHTSRFGYPFFYLRDLLFDFLSVFLTASPEQHFLQLGDQPPERIDLTAVSGYLTREALYKRMRRPSTVW